MFFALPEAAGYLLAGGAGLAAAGITSRPTQDLDLFTTRTEVHSARDALRAAASVRGWVVDIVKDSRTFCRLVVHGPHDLLVDLAQDSAPRRPATVTFAGPTYAPEELAGRKLLALFDRAAARDFADIFVLARSYDTSTMFQIAADIDPGLERHHLANSLQTLARFTDDEIPLPRAGVPALRAFFTAWAAELRS